MRRVCETGRGESYLQWPSRGLRPSCQAERDVSNHNQWHSGSVGSRGGKGVSENDGFMRQYAILQSFFLAALFIFIHAIVGHYLKIESEDFPKCLLRENPDN